MSASPAFARISRDVLRLVSTVPLGRVCTFADLGAVIDVPARHVAFMVSRLDAADRAQFPVHCLVGAGGVVSAKAKSAKAISAKAIEQLAKLQLEGIAVVSGKVLNFETLRYLPSAQAACIERTTRPPEHQRGAAGEPALSDLRGLGPASVAMLAAVGVTSAAHLRRADVFNLYATIKRQFPKTSANLIYAMIGALDDQDWRVVARERLTQVLLRLEEMGLL